MAQPPDVLVAGHVCVDITVQWSGSSLPPPGALWEIGPARFSVGGCVGNTGLTLARLGSTVALSAWIGDDELADVIVDQTQRTPNVQPRFDVRGGAHTSYSLVFESPQRDRSFLHHAGANALFDGSEIDVTGVRLVHLGYPSLLQRLIELDARKLIQLLDRIRSVGATTSIDLAVSEDIDVGGPPLPELLSAILPAVDVFSPSTSDLIQAFPVLRRPNRRSVTEVAHELVSMGAAAVLLKAGPLGACLTTGSTLRLGDAGQALRGAPEWNDVTVWVTPADVVVRRTTGAGDAATAGFLHGVLVGASPHECARRSQEVAGRHISTPTDLDNNFSDQPTIHRRKETTC